MKAIIYAGIGLFSVATVYGVTDYYSSNKKGELKKMYVEEKQPAPSPVEEEKTVEVIPVKEITPSDIKVVKAKTKQVKKEKVRKIRFDDFSRARIPERIITVDSIAMPVKKQD